MSEDMKVIRDESLQASTTECILPSRGVPYDNELKKNGGEIVVRPWNSSEQKVLASAKNLQNRLKLFKSLIEPCILSPANIVYDDLLLTDAAYILFVIRQLTYGDTYRFDVKCSEAACGAKFKYQCNPLKDLTIKMLDNESSEPPVCTLPVSGDRIKYRYYTCRDEETVASLGRAAQLRSINPESAEYDYRIAVRIVAINDDTTISLDDRVKYFSDLHARDSNHLLYHMNDNDPGMEMDMDMLCPVCDTVNRYTLPITIDFFRPKY